ncbi:hypothetical protein [Hyalangium rubrum]|uniref:Lipoprotein n=1 Tax=Hyalangium rubrum TaxID=3103134 RepID=A0ABU5H5B0_9BACT|nr:hypothetical protein [Hyalangium sp. s54d21]MDY7228436.1 hypothetical protein [Hyalangium sp. s54d21]
MSVRTSLSPLLLAAALAWGCTKEEAPPQEDRTLAKLRAEAKRVEQGGTPSGPPVQASDVPVGPNAGLADLATGEGAESQKLPLPEKNDTVHVDSLAVKLTGLLASNSVQGSGKVGLTTEERFLSVHLVTQNVGTAPVSLSLEGARLVDAEGKEHRVARDAQIVGGTRELRRTWELEERTEVVILFELPPAAIGAGMTLVLPASSGDVRLALQ